MREAMGDDLSLSGCDRKSVSVEIDPQPTLPCLIDLRDIEDLISC